VGDGASWERLGRTHGHAFTHVASGAALTPKPEEELKRGLDIANVNFVGALRAFGFARECATLRRFLLISSDAVMSAPPSESRRCSNTPPPPCRRRRRRCRHRHRCPGAAVTAAARPPPLLWPLPLCQHRLPVCCVPVQWAARSLAHRSLSRRMRSRSSQQRHSSSAGESSTRASMRSQCASLTCMAPVCTLLIEQPPSVAALKSGCIAAVHGGRAATALRTSGCTADERCGRHF
jgi:hypothetical protein